MGGPTSNALDCRLWDLQSKLDELTMAGSSFVHERCTDEALGELDIVEWMPEPHYGTTMYFDAKGILLTVITASDDEMYCDGAKLVYYGPAVLCEETCIVYPPDTFSSPPMCL